MRRQFRATVIANRGQFWVNTLADAIAGFEASLLVLQELAEHNDVAREEWTPIFKEAASQFVKIRLLLNQKKENAHRELVDLMDRALHIASAGAKTSVEEARSIYESLSSKAQQVLDQEQSRIRGGF